MAGEWVTMMEQLSDVKSSSNEIGGNQATPRDRTQATVRFIRAINPNVAKFLY